MKKNQGITLIALIITIIIMLILVAVTVSIIINSGIIGKAQKAKSDTQTAYTEESSLGDSININGTIYTMDEYLNVVNSSSLGEGYGLSNDGTYFVGQRSIGKFNEGEEDNIQTANWDASKNGYVFETGHFIYAENYEYHDITANVYLCWDEDGLNINSVADRLMTSGTFDIFYPSGAYLGRDLIAISPGVLPPNNNY